MIFFNFRSIRTKLFWILRSLRKYLHNCYNKIILGLIKMFDKINFYPKIFFHDCVWHELRKSQVRWVFTINWDLDIKRKRIYSNTAESKPFSISLLLFNNFWTYWTVTRFFKNVLKYRNGSKHISEFDSTYFFLLSKIGSENQLFLILK